MPFIHKLARRLARLKSTLVVAATVPACTGVPTDGLPVVEGDLSVTLSTAAVSLAVNAVAQLDAVVRDASGDTVSDAAVAWSTSDPTVATVSAAGMVRGVGAGTASVIAASGEPADTALVTVTTSAPAPVASVTVSPGNASVGVGALLQLTALLHDSAGNELTGRQVSWTSSNPATAAVSSSGVVTGMNPGSANITATSDGRSDAAEVTVTPPPPAIVLFASSWSTGTGLDPYVVFDSGSATPWNMHIGNGHLSEVVPATALDFPTPNALRVTAGYRGGGGAAADNLRLENGLPPLAVGDSRYYRWYIRVAVPDSYQGDDQTHPIQDGTNGSVTNWMFQVFTSSGSWTLSWSVEGAWPNNRWICSRTLQKHRTYRVELKVTHLAGGAMRIAARAYDSAGALVCGESDFLNVDGTLSLAGLPIVSMRNPDWLRGVQVGFNGLDTGTPDLFPMVLYYQGAVAVCRDDWCGPYTSN